MAWYDPGKQVVCVDDEWHDANWLGVECPLVSGRVYTVAGVSVAKGPYRGGRDHLVITLEEALNPYFGCGEGGFALARFRPVHPLRKSTEKGVQLLKDIAARKREPEEA